MFESNQPAWTEAGLDVERQITLRTALERALHVIPLEFRVVLFLCDVESMSSREVAEAFGIPDATVRKRLHRARNFATVRN